MNETLTDADAPHQDAPDMDAPAGSGAPSRTDELAVRLRLVTARLARQLRRHTGAGLTPSQHSALACIDVHGPLTLGRLAQLEQVTPPTITRIVDRLEDDELVTRTPDPTDRRHTRVDVTAAGHRRMAESRSRRSAWLASRLVEFGPTELDRLEAALPVLEALATSEDLAATGDVLPGPGTTPREETAPAPGVPSVGEP